MSETRDEERDFTEHEDQEDLEERTPAAKRVRNRGGQWLRKALTVVGLIAGLAAVAVAGYTGYTYASSPVSIREPLLEHYHFRMQVLVDGEEENFGADKYQEGYSKDNCNGALPPHPIHFHDRKNQFVHIHWEGMTGGQVLKYYGWNFIGGTKGSLGYRYDAGHRLEKIAIHGNILPAIPEQAQFYIYTGSADKYQPKSIEEFIQKDLEDFFGKESNFPAHELNKGKRSLLDAIFPKAYAHDGVDHGSGAEADAHSAAELTRLNNLLGDVIIFVQKDKPSDAQIKERFGKLEPLSESTCGG